MLNRLTFLSLAVTLAIGMAPRGAEATIGPKGTTFTAIPAAVRGTSVAYDPKNDVYLVVGTYGNTWGRFVSGAGGVLGTPFLIPASINPTHFPGVSYSPHANGGAGGFIVAWHESDLGRGTTVHARLVTYPTGPTGQDFQLANEGSIWETTVATAYATGATREFLVAWSGGNGIRARRINNDGVPVGDVFTIAPGPGDKPSLTYNPDADEFYAVYAGYSFGAFVNGQRVKGGTAAGPVGALTRLTTTVGTYITGVTYNTATRQYLAAWFQHLPAGVYGRQVAQDGTPIGVEYPISTYGAVDGLGIAYNAVSGTSLAVVNFGYDIGGVEVGASGVPATTIPTYLTAIGGANYYPKVAASTQRAEWLMSDAYRYTQAVTQLVGSDLTSGPPPPPPPPPGPVVSSLTPDRAFPTFAGTTLTWTATASGGTAPLLYQFWRWRAGTGWVMLRDYLPSNSIPYTVLPGQQRVQVRVKATGSSASWEAFMDTELLTGRQATAIHFDGVAGGDAFTYNRGIGVGRMMRGTSAGFTESNNGNYGAGYDIYPNDYNGDGLTDLLQYNPATGDATRALNNGANGFDLLGINWPSGMGVTTLDMNDDGASDVFLYSRSTGVWWRCISVSAGFSCTSGQWGLNWQVHPGDFNGDGRGDLFLYNDNASSADAGRWFRVLSQANGSFQYIEGDIRWFHNWRLTPGDYNGDGSTDLFLYGPDGTWFNVFFTPASARYVTGKWATGWLTQRADFDANGRADLFLYNPSLGQWFMVISNGDGSWSYYFGSPQWAAGWQPLVSDFDMDGRSDVLLYNPVSGGWAKAVTVAPGQFLYSYGNWGAGNVVIGSRSHPY